MAFQCDYSGKTYEDDADGIYEDGDWINWDYILQPSNFLRPQLPSGIVVRRLPNDK